MGYLQEPYSSDLDFGTGEWNASAWVKIPSSNTVAGTILSRSYTSGPYISLNLDANNKINCSANDNITTRLVTTASRCNTATWLKVDSYYTSTGSLSIAVNGVQNATTTGTPLGSLNNANAVFTIGNSYAADAPFPGSIALVKLSATVPTTEQLLFMYEQEKHLFANNTCCVLPANNEILDLSYDDYTGTYTTLQANTESTWSGLVRTSNTTIQNTSYSLVSTQSGIKLSAKSNNIVDVITNTKSLISALNSKETFKSKTNQNITIFDYSTIGFSANTTNNSTNLTSVVVNNGTPYVGMRITGNNIPSGAYLTGIYSGFYYMSNNATGNTSTRTSIAQASFTVPVGYNTIGVTADGIIKQEGATKDYIKNYDGFKEIVVFNTSPGTNSWVQLETTAKTS